jgi:hypothetical protein
MHVMGWATERAGQELWARAEPLEEAELMGDKYTKSAEEMAKYTS